MALTDLTNTAWVLNNQLSSYAGGSYSVKRYNVDIVTEEATAGLNGLSDPTDTFSSITIGYSSGSEDNQVLFNTSQSGYVFASGHDTKTLPDTWGSYIDIPFTITGGTDATNSDLIAWLENNATPYTPKYYVSSIQLTDGTTCIIKDTFGRQSIPYGVVTSNSTTVFTATVDGVTELSNGVCCLIRNNNKQTSESGWTLDVNNLGAKPVYNNMADASRETTIFNKAYTMLFIYDENRVEGGCWICYRGYDSNTNTIGYQLRTNSTTMNVSDTARYYKLYFTSADNTMWIPASVNSTNDATTARPVNQRPINPFGRIVYMSASTNFKAGANLTATAIWEQYTLALGYSFNRTGAALTLTVEAPVYIKCAPQSDGSAIMDSDTPFVQALPSTADGKIYIYIGVAYSATNIELVPHHPVYYHDGTAIRIWTGASGSSSVAWNDITGKPTFATVATSGSYNDLSNKPSIPTVPTNVSAFTNDAGYLTSAVTSFNGNTGAVTYTAPVTSVNGNTGAITGLQTTANKVTSLSSSSTDTQYPSAKCVYDAINTAIGTAIGGSY